MKGKCYRVAGSIGVSLVAISSIAVACAGERDNRRQVRSSSVPITWNFGSTALVSVGFSNCGGPEFIVGASNAEVSALHATDSVIDDLWVAPAHESIERAVIGRLSVALWLKPDEHGIAPKSLLLHGPLLSRVTAMDGENPRSSVEGDVVVTGVARSAPRFHFYNANGEPTGTLSRLPQNPAPRNALGIAVSPDSRFVYVNEGVNDVLGTITSSTGEELHRLESTVRCRFGSFSNDGKYLAVWQGPQGPGASVFDCASGERVTHIGRFPSVLMDVRFTPAHRIVVWTRDNVTSVWTLEPGAALSPMRWKGPRSERIGDVSRVEERAIVISGGAVLDWNLETGTTSSIPWAPPNPCVVAISPDGRRLAVGTTDGRVALGPLEPLEAE